MARRHRILVTVLLSAGLLAVVVAVVLSRSVQQSENDRADARLAAELAGAVRAVEGLGEEARARAVRLAASLRVQRAFARNDLDDLRRIAAASPGAGFARGDRHLAGTGDEGALAASAAVVAGARELGRVLVEVPIAAVEARTALAPGDRLVAGDAALAPAPRTLELEGRRYRALSTSGGPARLTALAPHGPIAAAVNERRRRILLAVLASLASVVFLALLAARLARPSQQTASPDDRRAADPARSPAHTGGGDTRRQRPRGGPRRRRPAARDPRERCRRHRCGRRSARGRRGGAGEDRLAERRRPAALDCALGRSDERRAPRSLSAAERVRRGRRPARRVARGPGLDRAPERAPPPRHAPARVDRRA